jgi:hypothetical protein
MSTPLFVREPLVMAEYFTETGNVLILGAVLPGVSGGDTYLLVEATDEAVLVEEIRFAVQPSLANEGHDAGAIALYITSPDGGADRPMIGYLPVQAGTDEPALFASGKLKLNLTLQVGWKLYVAHNVQKNGASGYLNMVIAGLGGILR